MWEAIIPAAASLIGGMLGRDSVEEQQNRNLEAQREFATHGVQWRVADARAAGLHPVYALGGGGASYSPSPIIVDPMAEAIRNMGQSIGQYFKAPGDRNQERRGVPPSVSNDSLGYDLEDAAMGADYSYGSGVRPTVANIKDPDLEWDSWEYQRPRITSARAGDASTEAGPARPGMTEYEVSPGFRMKFPSGTSLSEALESLENPLLWPVLLKINVEHYGVGWLDDAAKNLAPGYASIRAAGEKIGGAVGQAIANWADMRRAEASSSNQRSAGRIGGPAYQRNRVTGRIRGVEPTRPSDVPGYRGSW